MNDTWLYTNCGQIPVSRAYELPTGSDPAHADESPMQVTVTLLPE